MQEWAPVAIGLAAFAGFLFYRRANRERPVRGDINFEAMRAMQGRIAARREEDKSRLAQRGEHDLLFNRYGRDEAGQAWRKSTTLQGAKTADEARGRYGASRANNQRKR